MLKLLPPNRTQKTLEQIPKKYPLHQADGSDSALVDSFIFCKPSSTCTLCGWVDIKFAPGSEGSGGRRVQPRYYIDFSLTGFNGSAYLQSHQQAMLDCSQMETRYHWFKLPASNMEQRASCCRLCAYFFLAKAGGICTLSRRGWDSDGVFPRSDHEGRGGEGRWT